ncbi:Hypothetical_protein [Hexamita inflata]|uniref:Hypothetical_protein n=1 Tax=Hexamita inflata TaxID=28002 RepID=A0AA86QBS7_9EUKA|nr:Hypothetical protein HINF_LOCUS40842 [Hexamita inflata]CAI9959733.1 Hypothetical protein HINF_LOCUS47378 [Hexamita inflata]
MKVFLELNNKVKDVVVTPATLSQLRIETVKQLSIDIIKYQFMYDSKILKEDAVIEEGMLIKVIPTQLEKEPEKENMTQIFWDNLHQVAHDADSLIAKTISFALQNSDNCIKSIQQLINNAGLKTEFGSKKVEEVKEMLTDLIFGEEYEEEEEYEEDNE